MRQFEHYCKKEIAGLTGTPLGSIPSTDLLSYTRSGLPFGSDPCPFVIFPLFRSTVLFTYSKYGGFPGLTTGDVSNVSTSNSLLGSSPTVVRCVHRTGTDKA